MKQTNLLFLIAVAVHFAAAPMAFAQETIPQETATPDATTSVEGGAPSLGEAQIPVAETTTIAPRRAAVTEVSNAGSEEWKAIATRAETMVSSGLASRFALERIRADLSTWRDRFVAEQSTNNSRIATVRAQIAALGPEPTEGVTEAKSISARRATLESQLSVLRAPGILADEASARASGLISEVDALIRTETTENLTSSGTVPIDPSYWPVAVKALFAGLAATTAESTAAINGRLKDGTIWRNIPAGIGILAVVALLVWQSRRWIRFARQKIKARGTLGASAAEFLLSLGQIILPLIGIIVLVVALQASGLVGYRGSGISDGLFEAATYFLVSRWLSEQLFPMDADPAGPLGFPAALAIKGHRIVNWFGWTFAIFAIVASLIETGENSGFVAIVLLFPLEAILAVLLFRMGRVMSRHGAQVGGYQSRLLTIAGRLAMVIAVVAVSLGAFGFQAAIDSLLFPAIGTLTMFGTLMLLQRLVIDLYGSLTHRSENAQELLIPALLGLLLFLVSLPLLALIWGVRVETLAELWAQFRAGFSIGDTRISPTDFLTFILVFSVGYLLTRLIQSTLRGTILPKTSLDIGGQNAIVSGLGYFGIFLAALAAITSAGIDMSSFAIVAGALSVGIGFGLQNIVSNFVAGIILLIERPISQGDWIEVGGQMGYVRDISVRSTRIETFDRTDVIVPNADLVSGTVTNYTRGNTVGRAILQIGVSYTSDIDQVTAILREITEAQPMVVVQPPPSVYFVGIGAEAFNFEIRAILRDINWVMAVKSDIYSQVTKRFAEENIEMPYATRDLWLRNPEALRGTDKK